MITYRDANFGVRRRNVCSQMVMIKLKIINYDPENDRNYIIFACWGNLVKHCRSQCEVENYPSEIWQYINAELSKHNAKISGNMLEFEDDAQASIFVLKWS